MNFCLPRPVVLLFENSHGVAGDENFLARTAYKLDGRVGDLKRIFAVRSDLDDIKSVVANAGLDPRFPELPDGFRPFTGGDPWKSRTASAV
jgi:hypothetical protein